MSQVRQHLAESGRSGSEKIRWESGRAPADRGCVKTRMSSAAVANSSPTERDTGIANLVSPPYSRFGHRLRATRRRFFYELAIPLSFDTASTQPGRLRPRREILKADQCCAKRCPQPASSEIALSSRTALSI